MSASSDENVRALLSGDLIHLNAHEQDVAPCLCKSCIDPDLDRVEVQGELYLREHAVAKDRVLFFWIPATLERDRKQLRRAVEARMHAKL